MENTFSCYLVGFRYKKVINYHLAFNSEIAVLSQGKSKVLGMY